MTDIGTSYVFTATWITALGAGIGLVLPASMAIAMGALSVDRTGSGSGLLQALRQIGGTVGVAILGTVLSTAYHSKLEDSALTAAALTAAMLEATTRWSDGDGRESLVTLMVEAVAVLEPLIAAL
ncbi:hypothetical protein GHK92_15650 [Nocardioides sp. dk4132]|uniref:hypothetical protein n=1 Tax=unclassified Nocardioides TaxID=2615069 RepID=UPI0012955F94|nr:MULTISPECIES: hypothetical protein [unclassified Nocardioides]MQW77308.1 hypothetical protein [Nocardioides sp. dk4132]QGA08062.1 hypothetical protein GFH29_12125 [Nocardioides sp. dk884]